MSEEWEEVGEWSSEGDPQDILLEIRDEEGCVFRPTIPSAEKLASYFAEDEEGVTCLEIWAGGERHTLRVEKEIVAGETKLHIFAPATLSAPVDEANLVMTKEEGTEKGGE